MLGTNHFFALSNPALVSALSKSLPVPRQGDILQRKLSDLGVERREVNGFGVATTTTEDRGCVGQQLLLSVADLVGMNLELFAQFSQRLVFT